MEEMERVYFDAEFTGLYRNAKLISIGFVSEHNIGFYAEFNDYEQSKVDLWIEKNVIENLKYNDHHTHLRCHVPVDCFTSKRKIVEHIEMKNDSSEIRYKLMGWLSDQLQLTDSKQIRIMTDCYAYDWMLLVDLLTEGRSALDMPDWINYIPIDLSTMLYANGVDPDVNREEFIRPLQPGLAGNPNHMGSEAKHNSLWDAMVIKEAFHQLEIYRAHNH